MAAVAGERAARRLPTGALLTAGGLVGAAVLIGAALPVVTSALPQRLALALPVALLALVVVLVLSFDRPRGVLVAGFALLSVVRSDPAPADLLFVVLMFASAFATWRRPARVPPLILAGLAAYALLSLLSSFNALDAGRAAVFEATTLYLICLAIWLTGVLRDRNLCRAAIKAYVITAILSALV